MSYRPTVLRAKQPLEMDNITELLEQKDIDVESHDSHVEYRGDRFDYTFWHGSVVQRDYGGNASRDDFEAWKIVYPRVEEDLKFPYDTDLDLPYEPED